MEIETQEEVVTQEPTSSQLNVEAAEGEFQENDAVTQEPASSELMVEVPIQARAEGGELQKEDVVTQEPTSPRVVVEVPMQEETVQTLIEETITLPVQNFQAETSDGKVCTQFS